MPPFLHVKDFRFLNKDENVHRFALSVIRGERLERKKKREREREREILAFLEIFIKSVHKRMC